MERLREERRKALTRAVQFEYEQRALGKDGKYRWFLVRYNPLLEEGRVRRWHVTATEIESRKQEEERVRQENVRLEERTRIARELHDTLLQACLGALFQLGAAVESLAPDSQVKSKFDPILQLMDQGIVRPECHSVSPVVGLGSNGSGCGAVHGSSGIFDPARCGLSRHCRWPTATAAVSNSAGDL